MNALLTTYLLVLLLPLFFASWRVSLAGLSLQGMLMAWMVLAHRPAPGAELLVTLLDLAVMRGMVVPFALGRVLRSQHRPAREDVIPPNLLSWAVVVALVILAFKCAAWLQPAPAGEQTQIAISVAGLLLGMFVLASQNGAFSQAVGALRLENAIALFELGNRAHVPLGLRLGQIAVFLFTVIAYAHFVRRIRPTAATTAPARPL